MEFRNLFTRKSATVVVARVRSDSVSHAQECFRRSFFGAAKITIPLRTDSVTKSSATKRKRKIAEEEQRGATRASDPEL